MRLWLWTQCHSVRESHSYCASFCRRAAVNTRKYALQFFSSNFEGLLRRFGHRLTQPPLASYPAARPIWPTTRKNNENHATSLTLPLPSNTASAAKSRRIGLIPATRSCDAAAAATQPWTGEACSSIFPFFSDSPLSLELAQTQKLQSSLSEECLI